jgi:YfiH family protein
MQLHTDTFSLYFGNAADQLIPPFLPHVAPLIPAFKAFKTIFNVNNLIFLRQIHSNEGLVITHENELGIMPWHHTGDYLVTHITQLAIGVLTADCAPLVLYDKHKHAIAVVHAGWRGAINGVIIKAIEAMRTEYNTTSPEILVFLGPMAHACCYEVTVEFKDYLLPFSYQGQVLYFHKDKYFFDLPLFISFQLQELGIRQENINTQYSVCTICNAQFYSYRRQGSQAGRQMTVAWLRPS